MRVGESTELFHKQIILKKVQDLENRNTVGLTYVNKWWPGSFKDFCSDDFYCYDKGYEKCEWKMWMKWIKNAKEMNENGE